MGQRIIGIADKFCAGKFCTHQELIDLKNWLSGPGSQVEVEDWLAKQWATSPEIDSSMLLEKVFSRISSYQKTTSLESNFSLSRILKVYKRIAAVLILPFIGLGILYLVSQNGQPTAQFTETIAVRGQKSQIVLSDGTKVWLNSDTKIKYPADFNEKQRQVYLDGEAFFDVQKNDQKPFVVYTSDVDVKVLGTKFNVKAYSNESGVETTLFEGKINLVLKDPISDQSLEKEMFPRQSFLYSKTEKTLTHRPFQFEEINGWKNNQLIFKDDTFSSLVSKIERWYDVEVIYDEKQFDGQLLTVELYEGERLDMLMQIISEALSVNYQYKNGKVILTPKK